MVISGIYGIVNCINQKCYIGSSSDIYRRWTVHKSKLRRGIHENIHLQASYNYYGEDAFVYVVLEVVEDAIVAREQAYLDAFLPEYNMARIAENNHDIMRSPEYRKYISEKMKEICNDPEYAARMSVIRKGKAPLNAIVAATKANTGRKRPPEVGKKIAKSKIGKKRSPETIQKMSISRTGKKQSPETIELRRQKAIGRKMSPDAIAKSSANRRGKKRDPASVEKMIATKTRLPRYVVDGKLMCFYQDNGYWTGRYKENGKWHKRHFGKEDPRSLYSLAEAQ